MKKRNKNHKVAINIIIIAFALFFLVLCLAYKFCNVNVINVYGLKNQTEEGIISYLFTDNPERSVFKLYTRYKLMDKEDIPFVEDYEITFDSFTSISVQVYEKSIIGYVENEDGYWYFDREGYAVECFDYVIEDTIKIEGMYTSGISLNSKLSMVVSTSDGVGTGSIETLDEDMCEKIFNMCQLILDFEFDVSAVMVDENMEFSLEIGQVVVLLGDGDDINQKLSDLKNIIEVLKDDPGTLNMRELSADGSYVFTAS